MGRKDDDDAREVRVVNCDVFRMEVMVLVCGGNRYTSEALFRPTFSAGFVIRITLGISRLGCRVEWK